MGIVRRVPSSLTALSGRAKTADASLAPVVQMAVSVMFPGNETVYEGGSSPGRRK